MIPSCKKIEQHEPVVSNQEKRNVTSATDISLIMAFRSLGNAGKKLR